MTFMTYVVTFPSLLVLRRKMPDVPRPFRVPGGWGTASVVTLLPTILVAFTVATLIWPGLGVGWFGTEGNQTIHFRRPSLVNACRTPSAS